MKREYKLAAYSLVTFLGIMSSAVLPALAQTSAIGDSAGTASPIGTVFLLFLTCCFPLCFFALFMLIPILLIGGFIINIFLIFDLLKRDFGGDDQTQVIIWLLILLLVGFPIGTVLYYYIVMQKYPQKS